METVEFKNGHDITMLELSCLIEEASKDVSNVEVAEINRNERATNIRFVTDADKHDRKYIPHEFSGEFEKMNKEFKETDHPYNEGRESSIMVRCGFSEEGIKMTVAELPGDYGVFAEVYLVREGYKIEWYMGSLGMEESWNLLDKLQGAIQRKINE